MARKAKAKRIGRGGARRSRRPDDRVAASARKPERSLSPEGLRDANENRKAGTKFKGNRARIKAAAENDGEWFKRRQGIVPGVAVLRPYELDPAASHADCQSSHGRDTAWPASYGRKSTQHIKIS